MANESLVKREPAPAAPPPSSGVAKVLKLSCGFSSPPPNVPRPPRASAGSSSTRATSCCATTRRRCRRCRARATSRRCCRRARVFARLKLPKVNPPRSASSALRVEDRLLADPPTSPRSPGRRMRAARAWSRGRPRLAAGDGRRARARGLRPTRAYSESGARGAGGRGDWHVVWARPARHAGRRRGRRGDLRSRRRACARLRLAIDEAARVRRPRRCACPRRRGAAPDLAAWSTEAGVPFRPHALGDARGGNRRGLDQPAAGRFSPAPRARRGDSACRPVARRDHRRAATRLHAWTRWRLDRERAALDSRREAIFRPPSRSARGRRSRAADGAQPGRDPARARLAAATISSRE